jgi:hypothetical protein
MNDCTSRSPRLTSVIASRSVSPWRIEGELIQMAPIGGHHMQLVNILAQVLVLHELWQ